jgi:hypothetical protein
MLLDVWLADWDRQSCWPMAMDDWLSLCCHLGVQVRHVQGKGTRGSFVQSFASARCSADITRNVEEKSPRYPKSN